MSFGDRMPQAAVLAAMLCAPIACASAAPGALLTVATPAEIAVVRADPPGGSGGSARGRDYVEIAVRGFRPSSDGPVQFVVDLPGEGAVEIGRFGLFPERSFSADDPSRTQRFSFPIDAGVKPGVVREVRIRLISSRGAGRDASADVTARLLRHE